MIARQVPPAVDSEEYTHAEVLAAIGAASGTIRIDMRLYQLLWGDAAYTASTLDRYREIADLALRRGLRVLFQLVGGPGGAGKHVLRVSQADYPAALEARNTIIRIFVDAALRYRRDPTKRLIIQEAHEYAFGGPVKDPTVEEGTWDSVALDFLRFCLVNINRRGLLVASPGMELQYPAREFATFDFTIFRHVDLIGIENYVAEPDFEETDAGRVARHEAKAREDIAVIRRYEPVKPIAFVETGCRGRGDLGVAVAKRLDGIPGVFLANAYTLGAFA